MSSSLDDLYKQVILDHYRNPRNEGELPAPPAVKAEGYNPLCGDEVAVFLEVDGDGLRQIRLRARGCSISRASASMMSEAIAGRDLPQVRAAIARFKEMMQAHADSLDQGEAIDPDTVGAEMGDLEALKGVVRFPVRIKCATLPWVTLEQGLADAEAGSNGGRPVSTEEPAE